MSASGIYIFAPASSDINCPPVKIAISSNIDFLLSPKPGALTATTLTIPAGSSSASITINEGAANTTDEPTELIALTAALAGS